MVFYFFTRILARWDLNTGFFCFFFHILECNSFSPNFSAMGPKFRVFEKKIFGFFFTSQSVILFHRNFSVMGPKFRVFEKKRKIKSFFFIFFFFTSQSVILFHRNFSSTGPKFRRFFFHILECNSLSPEFQCDGTKIQGFLKKIFMIF